MDTPPIVLILKSLDSRMVNAGGSTLEHVHHRGF